MSTRTLFLLPVAFAAIVAPRATWAQLRLADALNRADAAAVANRIATAQRDERDARALTPLRGIVPTLRLEGGVARTTDPIGAFGTLLRQRRIGAADFAPARLNFPEPVTNISSGLVAELPLVNVDAWLGRSAATRDASASQFTADWTRSSVRADLVRAWFGSLLANDRVVTLEAATRAGAAHVRQAESMQRNGLVTASDAMLASVKAGELEAELASARGDVANARRGLSVLIGGNGSETLSPTGALPSADAIRRMVATDTLVVAEQRSDVLAAGLGAEAARIDAARARSARLPRVNGVARLDWNDPSRPFSGEKSWTVGVMATWSPLTGPGELAESRGAAARASMARAVADGAVAQARLESRRTSTELTVALERLAIAERGAAQAADAHRIVTRRYDGGLASVVELLDAAATETHAATLFAKTRYDVIAALAARRLALGLDLSALAALDSADSRPSDLKDNDR